MIDWKKEIDALPVEFRAYRCSGCTAPLVLGNREGELIAFCYDCHRWHPISFEIKDPSGRIIGRTT